MYIFGLMVIIVLFIITNRKITITLESDGVIIDTIKVKPNEMVNLIIPAKDGYDFNGWYNNGIYVDNHTSFEKNTVLKAEWLDEDRQKVKLSFVDDAGELIKSDMYKCGGVFGDRINRIVLVSDMDRTFVGWEDEAGNIVTESYKIECKDMTFKAKWEQ